MISGNPSYREQPTNIIVILLGKPHFKDIPFYLDIVGLGQCPKFKIILRIFKIIPILFNFLTNLNIFRHQVLNTNS